MRLMAAANTLCSFRITLPDDLAELYNKQADTCGVSVEDLLARRLRDAVGQTSQKGIYLPDEGRQEIEKLMGRNIGNYREIVACVRNALTVKVENCRVHLEQPIMERLRSRNFSGLPFDAWLPQMVREWAERFVELR